MKSRFTAVTPIIVVIATIILINIPAVMASDGPDWPVTVPHIHPIKSVPLGIMGSGGEGYSYQLWGYKCPELKPDEYSCNSEERRFLQGSTIDQYRYIQISTVEGVEISITNLLGVIEDLHFTSKEDNLEWTGWVVTRVLARPTPTDETEYENWEW